MADVAYRGSRPIMDSGDSLTGSTHFATKTSYLEVLALYRPCFFPIFTKQETLPPIFSIWHMIVTTDSD